MKKLAAAALATAAWLAAGTASAVPNPQDPFGATFTGTIPAGAQLFTAPLAPPLVNLTVITASTTGNLFSVINGGNWTSADFDSTVTNSTPSSATTFRTFTTRNGGVLTLTSGQLTYRAASGFTGTDSFTMALDAAVTTTAGVVDNWSQVFTLSILVVPNPSTAFLIRFRNTNDNTHFYTSDPTEIANLARNAPFLVNEGIAFKVVVPPTTAAAAAGLFPVYRFVVPGAGTLHLFTAGQLEINNLVAASLTSSTALQVEQIPFYEYHDPGTGVTIFRLFNRVNGDHFLTASAAERAALLQPAGTPWNDEGTAFYAAP